MASLRAVLLKQYSNVWLENIAHHLKLSDVIHAAYLHQTTAKYYPDDSIHLIAVDCSPVKHAYISIVYHNKQWLVTFKNELLAHLPFSADARYAELPIEQFQFHPTFAELYIFPEVVRLIVENKIKLGSLPSFKNTLSVERLTGNILRGKVIHVDGNENIISDISRTEFNEAHAKNKNAKFKILYRGKSSINRIYTHYDELQKGEALAFFNANDLLEIAQNMGNASSILGVKTGDNIIIEFDDK